MVVPWVAAGCFAWAVHASRRAQAPSDGSFPVERESDLPSAIAAALREGITERDPLRRVAVQAVWPEYQWPPLRSASRQQWHVWEYAGAIVCKTLMEAL